MTKMTMDANELRALADCLNDPNAMQRTARRKAADYLRAQADAQPVAWRCEVRDLLTQAEQCLSTAVQFAQWAHDEPPSYLSAWDYEADHIAAEIRAVLAAAPAAPQAEPIADSDADYWLRNRQPILDAIERAGFMLMSNASGFWLHPRGTTDAQAEPLSDERIAEIQRAAYERAAQECIETAAELRRCADGCTDGRYDWKADGAADCADAIRALGRQR